MNSNALDSAEETTRQDRTMSRIEIVFQTHEYVHFALIGDFDLYKIHEVMALIEDEIQDPTAGKRPLLLDMARASYIDSAGIGTLLVLARHALAQERAFFLVGPRVPMARLFEIAEYNKLLEIHPTIEEALTSLNLKRPAPTSNS